MRMNATFALDRPPRTARGFTLTEIVVTMIILGILAVALLPNLTGVNVVQQRADYDKLTFAVQYARKAAIARRRYACVALSATSATLTIDANPPESTATPFGGTCPFATALPLPAADTACSSTNQTCLKTISMSAAPTSFQFDPLGRASTPVTITISGFPSLKVESDTGLVH
jgi:MSHA pilin protein MshC